MEKKKFTFEIFKKLCFANFLKIRKKNNSAISGICHFYNSFYSYQRTPVAESASLIDDTLTISSPAIVDNNGCPADFLVRAWSASGHVDFPVSSVVGDTLTAVRGPYRRRFL